MLWVSGYRGGLAFHSGILLNTPLKRLDIFGIFEIIFTTSIGKMNTIKINLN